MKISTIAILSAIVALPPSLFPQETHPVNAGHITYSVGKVSIQPDGRGDWIKVSPGLELSAGDNLWADVNSEVEIRTDSTVVLVGPETSIAFDQLTDSNVKLNLRLGSVIVQMPEENRHWEIRTPNLRFTLSEIGDYRHDVNGEGDETDVAAKQGHRQAIVYGTPYKVLAGQQVRFKTANHVEVEVGEIPEPDSFDIWAASHDRPQRGDDHNEKEEVADVATDPAVTERATRRVWETDGDAAHWVYTTDLGPVWVPTHWSELIILPPQPVGVVLVQPVSAEEMSVGSSGHYAVLEGVQKPAANWPSTKNVLVLPAQTSTQNNSRAWTKGTQSNSDFGAAPSLANIHRTQAPLHAPQLSLPHKTEPPLIPAPKPQTSPSDKLKK